jgi:hypothetical protein
VGSHLLLLVRLETAVFELLRLVRPFWRNQMVAPMKSANWRNSDCQFSMTLPQKWAEVTYVHHDTDVPPCVVCSALYVFCPANDYAATAPM